MTDKKWTDDITNVRTWEIWKELQENQDMTHEDIKNLPLECFAMAGVVQKIIRRHKIEWNTHQVKPCNEGMFHGIKCLENEDQYGFFKSDADVRPSSCMWVDKDAAEHLHNIYIRD